MTSTFEAIYSAAVYTACAVLFCRSKAENVSGSEKLCRSRTAGFLLTFPAVLFCVPLAEPVTPDFLMPLLLPLAVILPVLCIFYIDHYAARGLALWMISSAYGIIHAAFERQIPGAGVVTVIEWAAGIAGIWISAKPYLLRDMFRKAAVNGKFKILFTASAAIFAAAALYSAITWTITGGR